MSRSVTRSNLKRAYVPLLLLAFITLMFLGSLYYYFKSDHRINRFLASHDWESYTVTNVASTEAPGLGRLKKITEKSQVLFLPNHSYSRVTRMSMTNQSRIQLHLTITESGYWEVSGGYLQVRPKQFNKLKTGDENAFSNEQIMSVYQYFQANAEQSNRVDILTEYSVLLTGLNTRSQVLNAAP
ncbi:regulatory protein ToxS [Photobacterium sp. CCB-ST2H9]|uniref:regulatory protein ToxS n=1 Tax=Photobacterium sp. CCB-ST2H9 TaxID=2912855 RepID=UPI0020050349|nr:regulatory protein ToxS [Photobacterium sp. CCB-ST2H9]UTM58233.1 regulatory protein ToxS [Photobacterium sp. CCB-ST2H9]